MENMKISDCLGLADLANTFPLLKKAEIHRAKSYHNGDTVYLIVVPNSEFNYYKSRIHSAVIVVIDNDGRMYLLRVPHHLSYDIYYAFKHLEGLELTDDKASLIIGRGTHDNNNLLSNQSNELFIFAFGSLNSEKETGAIICERRR